MREREREREREAALSLKFLVPLLSFTLLRLFIHATAYNNDNCAWTAVHFFFLRERRVVNIYSPRFFMKYAGAMGVCNSGA